MKISKGGLDASVGESWRCWNIWIIRMSINISLIDWVSKVEAKFSSRRVSRWVSMVENLLSKTI